MERKYLHELYPSIPIGMPLELLLHADRSQHVAQRYGVFNTGLPIRALIGLDKMKGSPGELVKLELEVAEKVHRNGGDREDILHRLTPKPGWTLPDEVRQALEQWEQFDVRTLASTQPRIYGDRSYYNSGDAYNPTLPGEVADYLGVGVGESRELRIVDSDDTATIVRNNDSIVQLFGLGAHLAKRGTYRGEITLRFSRDNTLAWGTRGIWEEDKAKALA